MLFAYLLCSFWSEKRHYLKFLPETFHVHQLGGPMIEYLGILRWAELKHISLAHCDVRDCVGDS